MVARIDLGISRASGGGNGRHLEPGKWGGGEEEKTGGGCFAILFAMFQGLTYEHNFIRQEEVECMG